MIKILTISLFTLFNFSTYAQVTLNTCVENAVDFSSTITIAKKIPTECIALIESTRNSVNEDNSSDNFIEITGYKNILFTKEYSLDLENNIILYANRFTAGHNTKLTDIIAVDFLEDNSKIYVLNKNGTDFGILSFIYNISGNLVPSRELSSLELLNATNLRADYNSSKLFIISATDKWIKAFNLKADPTGKKSENSIEVQSTLSGSSTSFQSPIDLAIYGNELYVLDNDRILVFNKTDNGSIVPKRTISGSNTSLSGSKKIDINSNNQIEVVNGDNLILKFSTGANGNISPL